MSRALVILESARSAPAKTLAHGTRGRLELVVQGREGLERVSYPALVSANTKPDEKPFRLNWFKLRGKIPASWGHVSVSEREANAIVAGTMPTRVWLYVTRGFDGQDARFIPEADPLLNRLAERRSQGVWGRRFSSASD
jgi:hypothetical protein